MKKKTWDEMYDYLVQQDNCRVNGKGFAILNLKEYLGKMNHMINLHDPEIRWKTTYCLSLKGSLERVYNGHKAGNTEPANTIHPKKFSIYGT
jgi:hypothetical protein